MSTPLEKPIPSWPTPNIQDLILVEVEDPQKPWYQGLEKAAFDYGSLHDDQNRFPGYKLVHQEPRGEDKLLQRVYAKDRTAQDSYNAAVKWLDEDDGYPVYQRNYLILASSYIRGTDLDPLRAIIGLSLVSGGTGYDGDDFGRIALAFAGGGGSGASGYGLVTSGVITNVYLTNCGSGYTSAPTVSAAGGAGLSVTALLQSTSAKQIHEESQRAPEPFGSLYLIVTKIFKTLPGPWVYSMEVMPSGNIQKTGERWNIQGTLPTAGLSYLGSKVDGVTALEVKEILTQLVGADGTTPIAGTDTGYSLRFTDHPTNAEGSRTYRIRGIGAIYPAIGSAFGSGTVIDFDEREIRGSTNAIQIIMSLATPEPWVEYPVVPVTFPGILKIASASFSTDYNGRYQPPWPGDGTSLSDGYPTFYQLYPRQKKVVGRVVNSFTVGASGWVDIGWSVYTPGVASRVFSIPNDTVHGPIVVTEQPGGSGTTYTVENIPASTPSTYNSRNILTFPLGEERYKGEIYWRRYLQVSEATSPYDFPDVQASIYFRATGGLDIVGQPNPAGSRISLASDGADTRVVTIFGQRNNATGVFYTSENVTLAGTLPVQTQATYLWFLVTQVHAASSSGTRTITVRSGGTPASGSYLFTGVPGPGDTIEFGPLALTTVYTYRQPGRVAITCPAGASLVTAASPASYVTVTFGGLTKYFWFSNGVTTDPAPGGTGYPVVFTGAEANTAIAALLHASMVTNLTLMTPTIATNVVTITGIQLGVVTANQDAGADFTIAVTSSGTAQAANQIRTGWDTAGVVLTASGMAVATRDAINASGTAGEYWGTGTTANTYMEASMDTATVTLTALNAQSYTGGWTTNESSGAITASAIVDGSNGPLITTITPTFTDAYNDISFQNATLVLVGAGWSDEESSPYGAIEYNMPAYVGQITTDAIQISVTNKAITLRMIATGSPALPINYQVSANGTVWTNGATTLSSIGGKSLYDVTISETTVEYIRFRITNSNAAARAVHLEVFFNIT